ncbi:MAG: DUF3551 domain-containing protein [Pseudomonadota bacterium]
MWKLLLLIAAASLATMQPATSQDSTPEGPWCGREAVGGGAFTERCHFTSYKECLEIMLGGSSVSCIQNPHYVAPPAAPAAASPPAQARPSRPAR